SERARDAAGRPPRIFPKPLTTNKEANMPILVRSKAVTNFYRLADVDVVKNGITVQTSMTGNSQFPKPPVDLAVLKTGVDSFSALIAEAADGSKKVIARK